MFKMNNDNNVVTCSYDYIDKKFDKLFDEIRKKYPYSETVNNEEMETKINNLTTLKLLVTMIWKNMTTTNDNFRYSTPWVMFESNETKLSAFQKHFKPNMDKDTVMIAYTPDECMIVIGVGGVPMFMIGTNKTEISVTYLKNNIENKPLYDELFNMINYSIHEVMLLLS